MHDRSPPEHHAGPPAGDGGPHLFVDSIEVPELGEDDAHHLRRVLRVRAGDAVTMSDGKGRWCPAVVVGHSELEQTGDVVEVPVSTPEITVGFVVTKGDRPGWVVQKLTELGVDRIQLLWSARSVVRWDEAKAEAQLDRLRTVARGAAMQSRQVRLPAVVGVDAVDVALAASGGALAHRDGAPPSLTTPCVYVGPEGGWDAREVALSPQRVALGLSVLRADTAAVVAGTALTMLRNKLAFEHSG